MTEEPSHPPISTFVIRFWREWSAVGPRWRGSIEHVQSGGSAAFLEASAILDFVRSFGVMESRTDDRKEGEVSVHPLPPSNPPSTEGSQKPPPDVGQRLEGVNGSNVNEP